MKDKRIAVVWDLHGVLADTSGRSHLVPEDDTVESNWYEWSKAAHLDKPIGGSIVRMALDWERFQVHIVTACSEVGRECTEAWLEENAAGAYDYLCMRRVDDGRPDRELKVEYIKWLLENDIPVVLAYEDLKSTAEAITEQTGTPVMLINPAYDWMETAVRSARQARAVIQ